MNSNVESPLKPSRDLDPEFHKIACEHFQSVLEALHLRKHRRKISDWAIHTARKRIKELRALLRLLRATLGEQEFKLEQRALREAGRALSALRDASVLIITLKALQQRYPAELTADLLEPLADALRKCRKRIRRRMTRKIARKKRFIRSLEKIRARLQDWKFGENMKQSLYSGLARSYQRAQTAMVEALAGEDDRELHAWRRRTKDLRYQLELLALLGVEKLAGPANEATELTELLGVDHDLSFLRDRLDGKTGRVLAVETRQCLKMLIKPWRTELQEQARALGTKLFAGSPAAFMQDISPLFPEPADSKL